MIFNEDELILKLKERIKNIENVRVLYEVKNVFTKEFVKPLYEQLSNIENKEEKREFGQKLQKLQNIINELINETKEIIELYHDQDFKPDYDLMLPSNNLMLGNSHVLQQIINNLVTFFKQFHFKIVDSDELTTTNFCFDVLNVPNDHPGRSSKDTFYINQKYLLRTHCTASTIKAVQQMNKLKDIRVVSFGNVYRNDTDDATHSHQFTQLDFMWIRRDMSLANLKWFIQKFINHIFNENIKIRFRLSYFPFTEPSFEVDIRCWNCTNGCAICKYTCWIEILGSGLLHPNVLKFVSINSKLSGLAAGIGIERIAMIKHGINDIRDLYRNDFRFNEQFRD